MPGIDEKHWQLRIEALTKVGRGVLKCNSCDVRDPRLLTFNHRKGQGKLDIPDPSFPRKILDGRRSIEDLDLRCCNCQVLYEFEQGRRSIPDKFLVKFGDQ